MRVKSAVILEQDHTFAEGLEARLARAGWVCMDARSVADARALLSTVRPAVVVVDRTAWDSDPDGVRRLREDPFLEGVPMVLAADEDQRAVLDRRTMDAIIPRDADRAVPYLEGLAWGLLQPAA